MATITFPADAIATGEIQQDENGTYVHAETTPVSDILAKEGYDPSQATVSITIDDQYIVDDEDLDGDGDPDAYVASGTPLTSCEIDADGDGEADYVVHVQNPNQAELTTNGQVSGNVAEFNGGFTIYDAETGEPVGTVTGNVFLASNGEFSKGGNTYVTPTGDEVFVIDDIVVPCFTRGTWIKTPTGPRRIEELAAGDLVTTLDHGPQPIRWAGSRRLGRGMLTLYPNLRPIRIAAGALGQGLPARDLLVSPQHRVMLSSRIVRQMFDSDDVLVPAKKLLGLPGVSEAAGESVEYFHILLDRHEVVIANGAPAETLLLGRMALKAVGSEMRREIALIFPEIAEPGHVPAPARCLAEPRRIRQLVARHVRNNRDLCDRQRLHA